MNKANQLLAFDKFSKLKVGAVFMQMGTGKTKIAIDLINYNINKVDLALFICPNSTKDNLLCEIEKWGLNISFLIKSYENISQSDKGYLKLLSEIQNKKIFLVADESIFIKNEKSKRFNRIMKIAETSKFRLILNGTPLVKNEWDLYNQMYFLSPKILNMGRNEFLNTFFTNVKYKRKGEKKKQFYKFSEVNAEYLTKLIQPYIFESELNFGMKETEISNTICCSEKTEEKYKELKGEMLDNLLKSEIDLIKYLQNLSMISACDDVKNKQVGELAKGRQVIVFCQFLNELRQIKQAIGSCYVITGETPRIERDILISGFKSDNKPLLMTLGVGAYGLNLQFCNEIIFSSSSFDYGKMEQAKFRIKRIGQENDIKYTYFRTDLKICNLIEDNLEKKKGLSALVKEGLKWEKII